MKSKFKVGDRVCITDYKHVEAWAKEGIDNSKGTVMKVNSYVWVKIDDPKSRFFNPPYAGWEDADLVYSYEDLFEGELEFEI